jgi:hypothetical protein
MRSRWLYGLAALIALTGAAPVAGPKARPDSLPAAPDSAAAAVIARVIQSYGGREALERIHAYRMEGTIHAIRGMRAGPTVRVFERPDRLKVGMQYPEGSEVRIVDGARGWRNSGGDPLAEAHGPMLDAMVLQACRAAVPWILIERGAQARRIEDLARDSVALIGIEIPIQDKLWLRAYVDPKSFRVAMSQGMLGHGGMQTQFETVYDDYRSVEGILFAFHEENYASGTHTAFTRFDKVILNPPLARDEFAPPAAAGTPDRGARPDTS